MDWRNLKKVRVPARYLRWAKIRLTKVLVKSQNWPALSTQCLSADRIHIWTFFKGVDTYQPPALAKPQQLSVCLHPQVPRDLAGKGKGKGWVQKAIKDQNVTIVMCWDGFNLRPIAFEIVLAGSPEVQVNMSVATIQL